MIIAGNAKRKMAGRVPLENVSERKNKMNARDSDDGY
jgi:hypothetical protein